MSQRHKKGAHSKKEREKGLILESWRNWYRLPWVDEVDEEPDSLLEAPDAVLGEAPDGVQQDVEQGVLTEGDGPPEPHVVGGVARPAQVEADAVVLLATSWMKLLVPWESIPRGRWRPFCSMEPMPMTTTGSVTFLSVLERRPHQLP